MTNIEREEAVNELLGIKDGDVIRFFRGKKDKIVSFTTGGKVIFSRDRKIKPGYYRVSNIEDREKTILVSTERVAYDYYPEIDYKEFKEVLKNLGFKIGFEEDFDYIVPIDQTLRHEKMLFAYNLDNNVVVVAESFDNQGTFNSIEVYCPGMNCFSVRSRLFKMGGSTHSVFDLACCDACNKNLGIMHMILNVMQDIVDRGANHFGESDTISLWNYVEGRNDYSEEFFLKMRQKINRADRNDMLKVFDGCKLMLEALE